MGLKLIDFHEMFYNFFFLSMLHREQEDYYQLDSENSRIECILNQRLLLTTKSDHSLDASICGFLSTFAHTTLLRGFNTGFYKEFILF